LQKSRVSCREFGGLDSVLGRPTPSRADRASWGDAEKSGAGETCPQSPIDLRDSRVILRDFLLSSLRLLRDGLATIGLFVFFLVLIGIGGMLYAASPIWAAQNWPTWAIVALFPVFATVLGVALFWLFEEGRRRRLFSRLMFDGLFGWLSPIIVAALIFVFAVSVFSVATYLLLDWNAVNLTTPSCEQCPVKLDELLNFYTWHFLNAIPLLMINESLQWNVPLLYSGGLAGWLVLAFKAAVILPLIQAIRTYLQVRKNVPRIRVRPWAWPRVTRPGTKVTVNWAATAPPVTHVFDVMLEQSRSQVADGTQARRNEVVEETWLQDTHKTSGKYTPPAPGVYRFRVACHQKWDDNLPQERREALEELANAYSVISVQSRPVTVLVHA
jgi:hypothetical protein